MFLQQVNPNPVTLQLFRLKLCSKSTTLHPTSISPLLPTSLPPRTSTEVLQLIQLIISFRLIATRAPESLVILTTITLDRPGKVLHLHLFHLWSGPADGGGGTEWDKNDVINHQRRALSGQKQLSTCLMSCARDEIGWWHRMLSQFSPCCRSVLSVLGCPSIVSISYICYVNIHISLSVFSPYCLNFALVMFQFCLNPVSVLFYSMFLLSLSFFSII